MLQDILAFVATVVGMFAFRNQVSAVWGAAIAQIRLLGMVVTKVYHHNLAVYVRSLLWWALVINSVAMLFVGAWSFGVFHVRETLAPETIPTAERVVLAMRYGNAALIVIWVVSFLLTNGFILWAALRLRGVNAIPFAGIATLYQGLPIPPPVPPVPPAPLPANPTPQQQADFALAQTAHQAALQAFQQALQQYHAHPAVQAAQAQILQTLNAAGFSERLTGRAFVALVLPFWVNALTAVIMNCILYTYADLPWHHLLPVGFVGWGLGFIGFAAWVFAAVLLAGTLDGVGGAFNRVLNIVVRLGALALPGITAQNQDQYLPARLGLPTTEVAGWIRNLHVEPFAGAALILSLALLWPNLWVVLTVGALLATRNVIDFAKRRRADMDTKETIRKGLVQFELAMLIIGLFRVAQVIAVAAIGMTWQGVTVSTDVLVGWAETAMSASWGARFGVVLICAVVAGIFFWAITKVNWKALKIALGVLGGLVCLVALVVVTGAVISALSGKERVSLDMFRGNVAAAQSNRTVAQSPADSTDANLNGTINRPAPPAPPRRGTNAARPGQEDDHPPRHARVRTALRDPCEGLSEGIRHTKVGRQRCR